MVNERVLWIGGLAVGATALVAGLAYAASKQTSSSTTTSVPPPPPPAGGSNSVTGTLPGTTIGQNSGVTLIAGAQTTVQDPDSNLLLGLPAGASWNPSVPAIASPNPAGITSVKAASGSDPTQALYDGSTTTRFLVNWLDSTGAAQTTLLTVQPTPGFVGATLAPGAQTVVAPAGSWIVLQLPDTQDGGSWDPSNMPDPQPAGISSVHVQRSGQAPIVLTYNSPVTLTLKWIDANGASQTTMLTIRS